MFVNSMLLQRIVAVHFVEAARPLVVAREFSRKRNHVTEFPDATQPAGVMVAERLEEVPPALATPSRDGLPVREFSGRRVYLLKDRRFVVTTVLRHQAVNGSAWTEWETHFVLERGEAPALAVADVVPTLVAELERAGVSSRELDAVEDILRSAAASSGWMAA